MCYNQQRQSICVLSVTFANRPIWNLSFFRYFLIMLVRVLSPIIVADIRRHKKNYLFLVTRRIIFSKNLKKIFICLNFIITWFIHNQFQDLYLKFNIIFTTIYLVLIVNPQKIIFSFFSFVFYSNWAFTTVIIAFFLTLSFLPLIDST